MASCRLDIRLLGELQIISEGREIALPPSKKTRALIGFLAATNCPHLRERLCDLLWEGPDDPRGELRWSLAKIRPLLDIGGTVRLKTDRSRVAFEPHGAAVDITTLRELLADVPNARLEALKTAVGLFRGEFLDGLDLPACYRFQEWCLAERESVSALRLAALRALVDRLGERPEQALIHARALVAADPLSEDGHASVVRLLGLLGRRREAFAQYEQARSVLERELAAPLSGALERARHGITPKFQATAGSPNAAKIEKQASAWSGTRIVVPFVGRLAERAEIDRLVSAAVNGQATPVLLVTGEPGIGKSRLLGHLAERMTMIGGFCLKGRAFEAESARSYGAWIDALRAAPAAAVPEEVRQHVALLLPELGPTPIEPTDRNRLFDSVLALVRHLGTGTPLAIILDDLQWLDEASSALLHYMARMMDRPSLGLLACAARPGELADNPAISHTLQGLERDHRVLEMPLAALSSGETAELVREVDPSIDPAAIFRESDGNPLFALELSRVRSHGRHRPGHPFQALITQQLGALDETARSLVAWASAIGRAFSPGLLARLSDVGMPALLAALESLERRGIFSSVEPHGYDFAHDLIRRGAYQRISQPRRKLMHRQIAHVLESMVTTHDGAGADLARHAELAGEYALAARACAFAGERSLRVFANAEAAALARRGRAYLDRLPDDRLKRENKINLFKIEVLAGVLPAAGSSPQLMDELSQAVASAETAGLHAAAATGHYLLSVLHQEAGDIPRAQQSTIRAAEAARAGDSRSRADQLANTARCLIELETDIPRARMLIEEAEMLLGPATDQVCEMCWGRGLLQRWDGNPDAAAVLIERAVALARDAEDRWREYKCLTWLALVDFERGRHDAARSRCRELHTAAEKLGEGEDPFAHALDALTQLATGAADAVPALERACEGLRAVDDKTYLAYVLNTAATLHLEAGRRDTASDCAREAEAVARAMQRFSDLALARATLARMGEIGGHGEQDFEHLLKEASEGERANARTQSALLAAAEAIAPDPVDLSRKRRRKTA